MRPWRDEDLDEEGRPWNVAQGRPWTAQDYLLAAAVLAMVLVVLALAGGAWQ